MESPDIVMLARDRHSLSASEVGSFHVRVVDDLPQAGGPPRILIIDCGDDTCRGLAHLAAAKRAWPQVPVLFVTSASSEEVVLQAWKGGAWEYFRTPLRPGDIEGAVSFLLEVTGCAAVAVAEPLRRCLEHIESRLSSSSISLADLASCASLSPYHFSRRFRQTFGMPPMAYVRRERVARAARLLEETQLPLSQVAYRVGFGTYSDFVRQFRKITGVSPGRYRSSPPPDSKFRNEKGKSCVETKNTDGTLEVSAAVDEGSPLRLRRTR